MSTIQIPETQRVWTVVRNGEPSTALELDEHAPVPSKLPEGEVLIKVQAAALNPVGYKMMKWAPNFILPRPYIAESDFSGIVVDANGTHLSNGQEVFGMIPHDSKRGARQGSLAEYIRIPATSALPRSSNVSAVEASGFVLAGMTAYSILCNIAQLEPGQSVFINGGSTAVGIFATQIAKAMGCTVTASASTRREEFLKSIGVDNFVDYTKAPLYQQLEDNPPEPKFHVFIEAVGSADIELFTHSPAYLAPNGMFISVGPQPSGPILHSLPHLFWYFFEAMVRPRWLGGTPREWRVNNKPAPPDAAKKFTQLIADGKLKPVVDSIYSFDDALKAYERIMTKHACGKVVVKVDPEAY